MVSESVNPSRSSGRNVLLILSDVVGERMAGPGIRAWELARVLSQHFQVTLALPPFLKVTETPPEPDFPARLQVCQQTADLKHFVGQADVIMTLGAVLRVYPFLAKTGKPLVVDAYDPFMLTGLQQHRAAPSEKRLAAHEEYRRAHLLALREADFVLCASEKQRDYWLGMLSAVGRLNPYTHDDDPRAGRLIGVVPFGLSDTPPRHLRQVLKGVYPGIDAEDKVVLWSGGIWDWLDAETAIRAMARIAEDRSDIKLFFMGTDRPNPTVAKMAAVDHAMALSRQLGLYERSVFFNGWVPYADRENFLLEADIGISLHRDVLETRFAFRTRLMDCLWAGLPVVATRGDVLGEELGRRGLGKLVTAGDEEAIAAAILELLDTPDLKEESAPRFAAAAADYRWQDVAKPLIAFCQNPRLAPDRAYIETLPTTLSPKGPWRLLGRAAWAAIRGS